MATMKNPTPSSSSFSYGWTYDVFLSFRGPDTRFGFTGHLYDALRRKGVSTFMDNREIEIGESITPVIDKAIQQSRIALVIFSKTYASSAFCLEELSKIMVCSKDKGMLVWPVFYHVDPSDLRHQKGSYAEALAMHEERRDKEKIEKWRSDLANAANMFGMHFKLDRYENELVENIIQEVSKKIPMPLHVAKYPVGLEYHVQKVKSLLDVESNDGVHVVGIYGIGGIGKTTLAREVYNSIAYKFRSLCFLEDIRENSMKHGLLQLRDKLLCELVGEEDFKHRKGRKEDPRMKSKLRQKKFLLILDDVDKLEQLKILLMPDHVDELEQFGSGSRIIITTRVQHLLQEFGVERTYKVEPLNPDEALELFSWSAFKTKEVNPSYKDISQIVIQYCHGIPLSVRMIGLGFKIGMLSKEQISPDLFDKAVSECYSALDTYERIPHENIQEIPYIRDSDKDNIDCNVDEKDNAQHLKVRLKKEQEEKEQMRMEREAAHLDTTICDSNKDKINYNVDVKDIAQHYRVRLKKEQEEKEQMRKEREAAHLDTTICDNNKDKINSNVDDKDIAQYYRQPKPQPIKYRGVEHLSYKLVHYDKVELSHPGAEHKWLKIFYHKIDKVVIHTISLPKQSAVEDVINYLKLKVELSHPGAELRLLKIFYHKIHKIFSPSEKIENINDQWTLRAEEVPEEEKNLGPHDQLIHVYHFMKVTAQNHEQIQIFGDPFFLVIHKRERLADIKLRIQKKLRVPNEEFSKWMFAAVFFDCPEYLKDSDIVSTRFKGRDIYGAWKYCYLRLEHADNAQKMSYAANQGAEAYCRV